MVEVYSASWCGPCKALKNALKAKGIEFVEYDLNENEDEFAARNIRTVPTVFVGAKRFGNDLEGIINERNCQGS